MFRAFILLLTLVLLPTVASADEELEQFEQHLAAGVAAIEQGDHARGLYELERAREYHDHPLLRYHVARAHEALGECAAASVQYRVVLEHEETPAALRAKARKALESAEENCGTEAPPPEMPAAEDSAQVPDEDRPKDGVPTVSTATEAEPTDTTGWKIAGWTLVGVGGAVLGTVAVKRFVVETNRLRDWNDYFGESHGCELDGRELTGPDCDVGSARLDPNYTTFEDQLTTANQQNLALLITGAGLAAAGTAVLLLAPRENGTVVSVGPIAGGVGIGLSTTW